LPNRDCPKTDNDKLLGEEGNDILKGAGGETSPNHPRFA
jgi:hypothetical protein